MGFTDRLSHAWNAFTNKDEDPFPVQRPTTVTSSASYNLASLKGRFGIGSDRSMIDAIYSKISLDLATIEIRHAKVDENDNFVESVNSGLNRCLNIEPNIDQSPQAFRQDIALSLFHKGVAAVTPVETSLDPSDTGSYDIKDLRVGEVIEWHPRQVKVSLYNDRVGRRQDVILPKRNVAIVENPLYEVMNKPNSTLQRLIHKLALLDSADEAANSGKLDLIIQLPYVVKSESRRQQAEQRRRDIETQLRDGSHGIAYTDGTERVVQLNRPAENNLLKQVEYLTGLLYTQLGLTPEIMNGTATEEAMLNYKARTLVPIMNAISQEMTRKFLTTKALGMGQRVVYFQSPFELVPLGVLAEMADRFSRNEIMTSNEIRSLLGLKPSDDPKANALVNSNMPNALPPPVTEADDPADVAEAEVLEGSVTDIESSIGELIKELGA